MAVPAFDKVVASASWLESSVRHDFEEGVAWAPRCHRQEYTHISGHDKGMSHFPKKRSMFWLITKFCSYTCSLADFSCRDSSLEICDVSPLSACWPERGETARALPASIFNRFGPTVFSGSIARTKVSPSTAVLLTKRVPAFGFFLLLFYTSGCTGPTRMEVPPLKLRLSVSKACALCSKTLFSVTIVPWFTRVEDSSSGFRTGLLPSCVRGIPASPFVTDFFSFRDWLARSPSGLTMTSLSKATAAAGAFRTLSRGSLS